MPVTPTLQNTFPTVGASADTWGTTLNARGGETFVDVNALAALANANETAVGVRVLRAGDTMGGDLALANIGATSVRSAGFRGAPPSAIDADKTFASADAGGMSRLFGSTNRTWTIPNVGTVSFQNGTAIVVRSFSTGTLTLARGAGVQLRIPGSSTDANRTVAPFGMATLVMEDTNIWVLSGVGVA